MQDSPAGLARISFDTHSVRAEQSVDYWIDKVEPFFDLGMPKMAEGQKAFSGQFNLINSSDFIFGEVQAQEQMFLRSRSRTLKDGIDHFILQIFLSGGGPIENGCVVGAGDLLVIDMGRPHVRDSWQHHTLSIVVPRDYDWALSRQLEKFHEHRLPSHHPMVKFLFGQIRQLWVMQNELSVSQLNLAIKSCFGLLKDTLETDTDLQRGLLADTPSPALAHVLRCYIHENLGRDLSVEELCHRFHISRAHLYRIFAPNGGVKKYILDRRLTRSYRQLLNLGTSKSVFSVAADCGFKSESHFTRSFKAKFGETPSDVRKDQINRCTAPRADRAILDAWLQSL